jgi:hypothetical protein
VSAPHDQALSPFASAADAGTARSLAQALSSSISSDRVTESGTVALSAASKPCVLTACLLENAEYSAVCTAASISAPEYPLAATPARSRSNSAGLRLCRVRWMAKICLCSAWLGRSTKNSSSKRPFSDQLGRQDGHIVARGRHKYRSLAILHPGKEGSQDS